MVPLSLVRTWSTRRGSSKESLDSRVRSSYWKRVARSSPTLRDLATFTFHPGTLEQHLSKFVL